MKAIHVHFTFTYFTFFTFTHVETASRRVGLVRGIRGAKGLEVVVVHDGDGRETRGHAEPEGQAGKRT